MRHAFRADRVPGHRGFTFLDLVLAIAVVGTLTSVLTPTVQTLRTSRNAAVATATLAEVRAAQARFHSVDRDGDGMLEFAGSLQELVDAGLLDGDLEDGRRQGYVFETAPRPQGSAGYGYLATPINQGQTGVRGFGGDGSGVFTPSCPAGEHLALVEGDVSCVRDRAPAPPLPLPIGQLSGLAAINDLNRLARGSAVKPARALLTDELVDQVKAELDADRDLLIAFEELLEADLLVVARRLAATAPSLPGGRRELGDDAVLEAILRRMQARIRQDLALGSGDETGPPGAPVASAIGFPRALFDLVSLDGVHGSLTVLLDLAHGLDPAPGAGQMTSADPGTNLLRKRRLVASVEAMFPLWGSRQLGQLREALAGVRERADGSPGPRDWVQGIAARTIVARVDATLRLVGEQPGG